MLPDNPTRPDTVLGTHYYECKDWATVLKMDCLKGRRAHYTDNFQHCGEGQRKMCTRRVKQHRGRGTHSAWETAQEESVYSTLHNGQVQSRPWVWWAKNCQEYPQEQVASSYNSLKIMGSCAKGTSVLIKDMAETENGVGVTGKQGHCRGHSTQEQPQSPVTPGFQNFKDAHLCPGMSPDSPGVTDRKLQCLRGSQQARLSQNSLGS